MSRRAAAGRQVNMFRRRPHHYGFGVAAVLVTAGLYGGLYQVTTWNPYWIWLTALSLTTGVMFILDKVLSKTGETRIPELILHLFTLAGGFPGQFLGRVIARHKTNFRKHPSFAIVFVVSLVIHGLLMAYWF
jgi:uncharacterized membrane protein YsdA (DUF1294 family)